MRKILRAKHNNILPLANGTVKRNSVVTHRTEYIRGELCNRIVGSFLGRNCLIEIEAYAVNDAEFIQKFVGCRIMSDPVVSKIGNK